MDINIRFDAFTTSIKLNILKAKLQNTYTFRHLFSTLGIACKNTLINFRFNFRFNLSVKPMYHPEGAIVSSAEYIYTFTPFDLFPLKEAIGNLNLQYLLQYLNITKSSQQLRLSVLNSDILSIHPNFSCLFVCYLLRLRC